MKPNIKQLEQKLTDLLGKNSYTNTKKVCFGKYAGSYDYGLIFDDDTTYFISNGKKHYEANLVERIENLAYFHSHNEELTEWTKRVLRNMNSLNQVMQIELKRLYVRLVGDCTPFVVFDCEITFMEQTRANFTYIETNFSAHCCGTTFRNYEEQMLSRGFYIGQMQKL